MSLVFRAPLISNSADIVAARNGTDTNITYANGAFFDGVTSFINFGTGTFFEFGTMDFTLSAQFATSTITRRTIVSKFRYNSGISQFGYFIDVLATGNVRAAILTSASNYYIIDSLAMVNDGAIHSVAIARSGATFNLYVNGILDNGSFITAGTVSSISTVEPFVVGKQSDATSTFSSPWTSMIKDVRFYDAQLNAQQVAGIYKSSGNFFQFI